MWSEELGTRFTTKAKIGMQACSWGEFILSGILFSRMRPSQTQSGKFWYRETRVAHMRRSSWTIPVVPTSTFAVSMPPASESFSAAGRRPTSKLKKRWRRCVLLGFKIFDRFMWPVLCNWSQLGLVLCWYPWLAHCTPLHWGVAHGAMGSFAGLEADTKHWQKQTGYRPLCCWTHSL